MTISWVSSIILFHLSSFPSQIIHCFSCCKLLSIFSFFDISSFCLCLNSLKLPFCICSSLSFTDPFIFTWDLLWILLNISFFLFSPDILFRNSLTLLWINLSLSCCSCTHYPTMLVFNLLFFQCNLDKIILSLLFTHFVFSYLSPLWFTLSISLGLLCNFHFA